MKRIFFSACLFLIVINAFSQNFPGYNTSNYSGVNGVFSNPANVVGSRYKWNVNLLSINAGVANNNASFKLSNITSAFDGEVDSLLFGDGTKTANGNVNVDIHGLSFMFNLTKKSSIAFTSRLRVLANVVDVDGEFIESINNDFSSSLPFNLQSSENQKVIVNGWTDWGLTYGHILYDKGPHFIKAGLTLKYLAGATNNYINVNKLQAMMDEDVNGDIYMTNASGVVGIGVAGIDFSDDEDQSIADAFNFNSSGLGADIGFIYEYRPANASSYPNQYKFRAGISILDVGTMKYTADPDQSGYYNINIPPPPAHWYPSDIDGMSISEMKDYFDTNPYFTNLGSPASYKVSLPTSLQVNADYVINKLFAVNLGGQINLVKRSSLYNSFYYNTIAVTPRFENKIFGAYLPLSYNTVSGFNAGLSVRVGPVFFGSGSVINALTSKSKQADFHIGFTFGGVQKK